MNNIIKIKNRILAISIEVPATRLNPKKAAIRAIIKKVIVQPNIFVSLSQWACVKTYTQQIPLYYLRTTPARPITLATNPASKGKAPCLSEPL
jgi:hypothetical protein